MAGYVSALGALLDGVAATGGGRTMTFRYIEWGHVQDRKRVMALQSYETPFTVRPIADPHRPANIGSKVARREKMVEIHAYWADGDDLQSPADFYEAALEAFKARIRANEKTTGTAWFSHVVNVIDGSALLPGNAMFKWEPIIVAVANIVDTY